MRSRPFAVLAEQAGPWHYATLNGIIYDHAPSEGMRWKLWIDSSATLRDPKASLEEKQLALRFIVHLVADFHEPLHVGKCCDKGGNEVKVKWFGSRPIFTRFGIRPLVDDEQLLFTEMAAKLRRHTSNADVIDWWDINPRDWMSESAQIRETIYPNPPAREPGQEEAACPSCLLVCLSIQTGDGATTQPAGVRLAAYLNAIYAEPQPLPPEPAADASQIRRRGASGAVRLRDPARRSRAACPSGTARSADPRLQRFPRQSRTASAYRSHRAEGSKRKIQTGGVAHLAAALDEPTQGPSQHSHRFRGRHYRRDSLDFSNYLDEPTITAMNLLGLEFNSVGNHEFDRGSDELKRMQAGGCAKFTRRTPCAVEPFGGARFRYLAANVAPGGWHDDLPGDRRQAFGPITIGFIGMTLKGTAIS